jgi:hypothetical protein
MEDGEALLLSIDEPFRTDDDRRLWQWLVEWTGELYKTWALDDPEEEFSYSSCGRFLDKFTPGYRRAHTSWARQADRWVFDRSSLADFVGIQKA